MLNVCTENLQENLLYSEKQVLYDKHRDKTRVLMPTKMFPRLKLLSLLFMGPTLVLTQSKETVF